MASDNGYILTGFLFEAAGKMLHRTDLERAGEIKFVECIGDTRWEWYSYRSRTLLRGEDPSLVSLPVDYRLAIRRSASGRVAVLSVSRRIADHVVTAQLSRVPPFSFRRVPIAVDGFVRSVVSKPAAYALSFVHARVPAFGASLRSVSFYGDDIGDASLFQQQIGLMNFFGCGLRAADGGAEIMRLSGDGGVSFYFSGAERLAQVEAVLGFLSREGYLPQHIFTE